MKAVNNISENVNIFRFRNLVLFMVKDHINSQNIA